MAYRPQSSGLSVLLVALIGAASGCASINVRPAANPFNLLDSIQASLSTGTTLSPRTLQTLRQLDLEEVYNKDPRAAFQRFQTETESHPHPDWLFALAEMAYLLGDQASQAHEPTACVFYYLSAGYAYHYIFDGARAEPPVFPAAIDPSQSAPPGQNAPSPFDPRFRLACDLYNDGLAHCIRTAQAAGQLDPRQQLHLPTPDGQSFLLTVQHHGFSWGPEEFGPLQFCADYQVEGLANQYRTYGLGVPLIGNRVTKQTVAAHAYYPNAVRFPVSAFFRFTGSISDLRSQHAGVLELYNPLNTTRITVADRSVPLETDLTTPLAYFLSHTDLQTVEYSGFLHPDTVESRSGIYMLEPYQPGKIPVLMVHGLLSSPVTWAPMFNDLRADPKLRDHYQFWFYLYPTGPGYLQAAADLRKDLTQLRTDLDPQGKDASLDNIVLVGHSMGGLVSHLLTVDSSDDFWHLVDTRPLDQLKLDPDVKTDLQQQYYFDRLPGVRRVVFIATPHRGSNLSPSWPGRLAAHLVQTPKILVESAQEIMKSGPGFLGNGKPTTSVDLLNPKSPALQLLVSEPRPPEVHFHSIIGRALPHTLMREVTRPFLGNEMTDGAVAYTSAHLDEAESEIIVPADHFEVHHHPLAVREVRRILLEHLREVRPAAVNAPHPAESALPDVPAPHP